jgi:UDP-2-acetamido-3-amino-2,3-dideoxy-glucuronate N-acetyltransferase
MESKVVQVAVVGVGRWGKNILREFNTVGTVTHVVYTGSPETETFLTKEYPQISKTTSFDEVLNDSSVNLIAIATPITTHYELVKKALSAGKNVFCEKPLATDDAQVKELITLAQEKNLLLFVGYQFLQHDVFQKIREITQSEKIEKVRFEWNKFGSFKEDILWNLLVHELSMAITLLGAPQSVRKTFFHSAISACDMVSLEAEFAGGSTCSFDINRISDKKEKLVQLFTDKNTYLWRDDELFKLDGENGYISFYKSQTQPLTKEIKSVVESISQNKPIDNSLSLSITEIIEGLK